MPDGSMDARVAGTLRSHGPLTRHDLARLVGLSEATVSRALGRLVAAGTVVGAGFEDSTGGRPPQRFAYNGAGRLVAGISVTNAGARALLMSLAGEPAGRYRIAFEARDDPQTRLASTLRLVHEVVNGAGDALSGLGVGVPGVVAGPGGVVTAIHELGWDRLALGDLLARHAGRPIILDNDANCLAVAEHRRGAGRGVDDLVAVVIRHGLGAGLVTNGRLCRGHRREAGEIGYLLTERASLRRLFPDRGDLEQRLGHERLAAEAARWGLTGAAASLPGLIGFGLRREGQARELAEELLDLVAQAVSALCAVLDPELIVIGGADGLDLGSVIAGVRERLRGRALHVPRIVPTALGADAITVGAACLALPPLP